MPLKHMALVHELSETPWYMIVLADFNEYAYNTLEQHIITDKHQKNENHGNCAIPIKTDAIILAVRPRPKI